MLTWVTIVVTLGASILSWIDSFSAERVSASIALLPLVFMAVTGRYMLYRVRLVVTPGGLEYRQIGYRVTAGWRDIERIDTVRPHGRSPLVEGILLSRSHLDTNPIIARLLRLVGQDRFIPLTICDAQWRDGPLGRQMKQYVPDIV